MELRRLSDDSGRFKMLAMDQTDPIVNPIKGGGTDTAPFEEVSAVKQMLARHLAPHTSAVRVDPPFGYATEWATWARAFDRFPNFGAMGTELNEQAIPFMHRVNELTDRLARPWKEHPCWNGPVETAPNGPEFGQLYGRGPD